MEFVFEADASAFLTEIDQGANACLFNHLQGRDELLAAFAALGVEEVAGHTFGMDADEDRFVVFDGFSGGVEVADGAFAQRQMRFGGGERFVGDEFEVAEVGWEVDGFDSLDLGFSLEAKFD